MTDVIDLSAPHAPMRANAARGLKIPFIAGLIIKAAGLHPVILASAGRIQEIHRRIDITRRSKQVQLFGLLALKKNPANIACRTQRKKVKRNRGSAKKHVLVIAMADRQS